MKIILTIYLTISAITVLSCIVYNLKITAYRRTLSTKSHNAPLTRILTWIAEILQSFIPLYHIVIIYVMCSPKTYKKCQEYLKEEYKSRNFYGTHF